MLKIKELREEKEISQLKLAQIIGTSQRNIGRWENGTNEPGYTFLSKLADFFSVSVDYLIGREDDFSMDNNLYERKNEKEKRLLDGFRSLSEKGKQLLLDQLETIQKYDNKESNVKKFI